jgi:predicted nucleic acid-binding protein
VVDSIILGELLVGILMLPAGRKRGRLEQWLEALVQTIDCVPWDAAVSRRWARLVVDLRKRRLKLPLLDGMIAATALERGLTIVTRNTRDFRKARVKMVQSIRLGAELGAQRLAELAPPPCSGVGRRRLETVRLLRARHVSTDVLSQAEVARRRERYRMRQ